jgi:hypothetical protein
MQIRRTFAAARAGLTTGGPGTCLGHDALGVKRTYPRRLLEESKERALHLRSRAMTAICAFETFERPSRIDVKRPHCGSRGCTSPGETGPVATSNGRITLPPTASASGLPVAPGAASAAGRHPCPSSVRSPRPPAAPGRSGTELCRRNAGPADQVIASAQPSPAPSTASKAASRGAARGR